MQARGVVTGIMIGLMMSVGIIACSAAQRAAILDLAEGACMAISVFVDDPEKARNVCARASDLRPFVEGALDAAARYESNGEGGAREVCAPAPPIDAFPTVAEKPEK